MDVVDEESFLSTLKNLLSTVNIDLLLGLFDTKAVFSLLMEALFYLSAILA